METIKMEQKKPPLYRVVNPNQDKAFEAKFNQNFEEKDYLVCLWIKHIGDDERLWEICHGRTEAYNYIKDQIVGNHMMDFQTEIFMTTDDSFVLVDGLPLKDRKSIYAFMKYVQQFYDDGFEIDDYVDLSNISGLDTDESDSQHKMAPAEIFNLLNTGISMEEFMGGQRYFQIPLNDQSKE